MITKHDTPLRVRKAFILRLNSDNRKQNLGEHAWLLCFALVTRFSDSWLQSRLQQDSTFLPAETRTLVFALLHSQAQQVPGFCSLLMGSFLLYCPLADHPHRDPSCKRRFLYTICKLRFKSKSKEHINWEK